MSSRIFAAPENLDWKKAYMAAVLERDRARLHVLIPDARKKLAERLRQLTMAGALPCDEVEAIHDALYLLEALRNSLSHREDLGSRIPDSELRTWKLGRGAGGKVGKVEFIDNNEFSS